MTSAGESAKRAKTEPNDMHVTPIVSTSIGKTGDILGESLTIATTTLTSYKIRATQKYCIIMESVYNLSNLLLINMHHRKTGDFVYSDGGKPCRKYTKTFTLSNCRCRKTP